MSDFRTSLYKRPLARFLKSLTVDRIAKKAIVDSRLRRKCAICRHCMRRQSRTWQHVVNTLKIYDCCSMAPTWILPLLSKVSKVDSVAVSNNLASPLRETHMPHGITQCYLPPSSGENPAFTPSRSRYSI